MFLHMRQHTHTAEATRHSDGRIVFSSVRLWLGLFVCLPLQNYQIT